MNDRLDAAIVASAGHQFQNRPPERGLTLRHVAEQMRSNAAGNGPDTTPEGVEHNVDLMVVHVQDNPEYLLEAILFAALNMRVRGFDVRGQP